MTATTLTCAAIEDEGLLVQLIDAQLATESSQAILLHLHGCSACLSTLAQVLEIHGRFIIDDYWTTVRGIDPQAPCPAPQ